MTAANQLLLLAIGLFGLVPSPDDLDRFPDHETCRCQKAHYQENTRRLAHLCLVHGWSRGIEQEWLGQSATHEAYWVLLEQARDPPHGHEGDWRIGRLVLLRNLVGWYPYQDGWHPPLFGRAIPDLVHGWRPPKAGLGRDQPWYSPGW